MSSQKIQKRKLPAGIVALGLVSMFMDTSSEMIHSVLPVFLATALGVSALAIGIIEGIAEATASIVKVFSGAISDWIGKRKPLLLIGYGLATITRPLFPLATSGWEVLVARFTDRVGKGIRGAPRDALVADITPEHQRGAAYGLRQSLDTLGSVIGPAVALLLMLATGNDFRIVFWAAMIPAVMVIMIIIFGVKEPKKNPGRENPLEKAPFPLRKDQIGKLGPTFWFITVFAVILALARYSDAFLVLRGQDLDLGLAFAPLILIVMSVVYAVTAYPIGKLSDRIGDVGILQLSIVVLIVANFVLAFADSKFTVFFGAALFGLNMGMTQGVMTAIVAKAAPAGLRGTAFGVYNLLSGIALLFASVIAGGLWQAYGPEKTFLAAAVFSAIALFGFAQKGKKALS